MTVKTIVFVAFEAIVWAKKSKYRDLEYPFNNDFTKRWAEEEAFQSREEAEAQLRTWIAEAKKEGYIVKHAAAHEFKTYIPDNGTCPVQRIHSLYLVFEACEPNGYNTPVGICQNPHPYWRHACMARVAGTDGDGDGWFLNYRQVETDRAWPANTIHGPDGKLSSEDED